MSLLRACSLAKCLGRRSLADVRRCFAERCQLCVSVRSAAVRRISGKPQKGTLFLTNISLSSMKGLLMSSRLTLKILPGFHSTNTLVLLKTSIIRPSMSSFVSFVVPPRSYLDVGKQSDEITCFQTNTQSSSPTIVLEDDHYCCILMVDGLKFLVSSSLSQRLKFQIHVYGTRFSLLYISL